jgi:PhzF family phenazine biosynthesis protein
MQPYYVVDAFSSSLFGGNPAAVCVLKSPLPEWQLGAIAAEFNLSETAYLIRRNDGDWDLRWFTPTLEVNFCGHATLAAAWVLWQEYKVADATLRFHTRSGVFSAERVNDGVLLNLPLVKTATFTSHLQLQNMFPQAIGFAQAGEDYLVELPTEEAVVTLSADTAALVQLPCRGIGVTAQVHNKAYQVVSRFFAPRFGINEDPVTGSWHCALAHYWGEKLAVQGFMARQASLREGYLQVTRLPGDRVALWGQAVVVMSGTLRLPNFRLDE